MPFCYAPWTNIDISPQGDIAPCCKFRHELHQHKIQNIMNDDLKSYDESNLLNEIKQDFLKNQWPAGCIRCRIEEENGIESKRQLDYERWEDHYNKHNINKDGYITGSVAFGNTCNLACITCGPGASSRWYKEHELIYSRSVKPVHFYKENFVTDFISQCPDLIHLDISGGEPFLSGVAQQKELLDFYIETGQAKNITIHYTTNATVYPDQEWWSKWKNFKEIDMQLSIDGVNARYEYIRYHASWKDLEKNVDQFVQAEHDCGNLRLSVSHTLSAYNIYYLDELFNWCKQKRLPAPWIGRVHRPAHMRFSVWPSSIKKKIVDYLSKSLNKETIVWANFLKNTDDSEYFSEFVEKTYAHDQYRGNSFSDTFPELQNLIKNHG
tara:strand:- start:28959 stop:30101 length:1143 start_codon:yes stop_codon:yes gene_type:complete